MEIGIELFWLIYTKSYRIGIPPYENGEFKSQIDKILQASTPIEKEGFY